MTHLAHWTIARDTSAPSGTFLAWQVAAGTWSVHMCSHLFSLSPGIFCSKCLRADVVRWVCWWLRPQFGPPLCQLFPWSSPFTASPFPAVASAAHAGAFPPHSPFSDFLLGGSLPRHLSSVPRVPSLPPTYTLPFIISLELIVSRFSDHILSSLAT